MAVVAIIAVGAFVLLSDSGPPMPGTVLDLVPEDSGFVVRYDIPAILLDEDFQDEALPNLITGHMIRLDTDDDNTFGDLVIDLETVEAFVAFGEHDFHDIVLLKGTFEFDDLRDDLDDAGYDDTTYRDYEVWNGTYSYGLLEETGYIIYGGYEDIVEDILKILYQDEGSLANAESEVELKRLWDKAGEGLIVLMVADDDTCDSIRRCRGFSLNYRGLDGDEVAAEVMVLFSSENAAEDAADDYDDIADYFERYGLDVADTESDGEFVTGQATAEISSRSSSSPGGPATEPVAAAMQSQQPTPARR